MTEVLTPDLYTAHWVFVAYESGNISEIFRHFGCQVSLCGGERFL
jgi:hypothetical protein